MLPQIAVSKGLIRDAEIERTLKLMAQPLLRAAGISPRSVRIYIVNDNSMNAFVTPGNNMFIHHGLIKKLKTPEMLQAVIAHEIGHIAGKHTVKRQIDAQSAKTAAGLGLLLAGAVAAAGGGEGAAGLAAGTQSAAKRNFFANTRSQESSADRSGVRYMAQAGIDPQAAIDTLKLFEGQNLLTARRQDPYAQTHPLSSQRVSDLKALVATNKPKTIKKPKDLDYWYERMVAKFNGFTNNASYTLRRIKASDTSEAAMLARAIAYHEKPDPKKAINEINKLINARPKDAYYHELKGQFLLETGDAKGAVTYYKNAVALSNNHPIILGGYGRALLAAAGKKASPNALKILQASYAKDARNTSVLRDLATAYARSGKNGLASLVTAERYALSGNFKQAKIHSTRAMGLLPPGSPGWLKAQDIDIAAARVVKRK